MRTFDVYAGKVKVGEACAFTAGIVLACPVILAATTFDPTMFRDWVAFDEWLGSLEFWIVER